MAPQSEPHELVAAWRALAGRGGTGGWRAIPISSGPHCRLLAGRRTPGDAEALLVGFSSVALPDDDELPQGRGFAVVHADLGPHAAGHRWLALWREELGGIEIFTRMAEDVVATLVGRSLDQPTQLRVFLARIRAWQDFMRRDGAGLLSAEEELGLVGELALLEALLSTGATELAAVEAWRGPLNAPHDYALGTGGLEVKSTLSGVGFSATITSLEQLDDSSVRPLYLAGVRMALDPGGRTLPDVVAAVRARLDCHPLAKETFNSRVLCAGYLDASSDAYVRRFRHVELRIFEMSPTFPRITRSGTSPAIRSARYQIDLDLVVAPNVRLSDALVHLGVA